MPPRCRTLPEEAWSLGREERADCPTQVRPAQAFTTRARGAREQPAGGGRETGVARRGARLRGARREPTEAALRSPSPTDRPLGSGVCWVPLLPQVPTERPGAMASPSGSPEDAGKLRGRDGRQRREAEDAPPEEKRLRLGLEGGSAAQEEGEGAPRPGREETGTQTGGEGRGVSDRGRERGAAGVGRGAPRLSAGRSNLVTGRQQLRRAGAAWQPAGTC